MADSPRLVPGGLIYLIGLSGSGKTTVGRRLAAQLRWPFVDIDAEIERLAARSVAEIFASDGEPAFRELERQTLAALGERAPAVVATGGGAPVDPRNRSMMHQTGTMVWLDAPTEILVARLQAQSNGEVRPLLQGDPRQRLEALRSQRQAAYAEAAVQLDTAILTPDRVVEEILTALAAVRIPEPQIPEPLWVRAPSQTYPVYIGGGVVSQAAEIIRRTGLTGSLRVIADARVEALHGAALREGLGDLPQTWYQVPPGEENKTLAQAEQLYDALLGDRIERGDLIVAFGGGVIGDLVGYVAATILRGVRFIQIPTTVLSHVDSSVGGKVGVDHPRGKNLIGAFHQPSLVLADVGLLRTLPPREIAAGWAEVVKIAVIQDSALFDDLEGHSRALRDLEPVATTRAIRRAVELKAAVVEQDERDLTGIRNILNYGHTLGHALEAATAYTALLHGEGVAIGMGGAAFIAQQLNLHPEEAVRRQAALLAALGLPSAAPAPAAAIRAAMGLDKKRVAGQTTWILPAGLGHVETRRDVPDDLVSDAIKLVTGAL